MNRLLTFVAASFVALFLVGCGEERPKPPVNVNVTPETTKTVETTTPAPVDRTTPAVDDEKRD